jgi:hypothetical protein
MVERNSTALCISLRPFQPALDTGDEIKVLIEGGWGGELISSKIGGWIAYTRALRPIFVSTRARQGASSGRTARTAILGNVNVTDGTQLAKRCVSLTSGHDRDISLDYDM